MKKTEPALWGADRKVCDDADADFYSDCGTDLLD